MTKRPINMVSNTTADMKADGNKIAFLKESAARVARGESAGNAILAQEARGQQELVRSEVLPTKGTSTPDEAAQYAAMGIVLGAEVSGDKLFRTATLPPGWKKVSTGHSMWSNLVDDQGRVRATIFYKAAFYDRDAFMNVSRRFSTTYEYTEGGYEGPVVGQVKDADGSVIFTTRPFLKSESTTEKTPSGYSQPVQHYDLARKAAQQWLIDNGYPDYNNVLAYW